MAVKLGFTAQEIIKDEETKANINVIKTWLPDEKLPLITNEQILLFLLRNDNNVEETKVTIKAHYYWKNKAPEIFNNRQVKDTKLEKTLEKIIEICVMPKKTQEGCAIIYGRLIDTNYKNISMEEYFKLFFMTVDAVLLAQPPAGIILVFNLDGVGLMHLTKIKLSALRAAIIYLQDCIPIKIKQIHCLNTPSFIETVMKLIRPFAKTSFLNKLLFHPRSMDLSEFHKYIVKEYLPQELGGELPSTRDLHRQHIDTLIKLEEYFTDEEAQRCI